jgi:hypothetical protein
MTRQDLIQRLTAIIDGQSVLRESLPMPPDQCRDAIHQQLQLLRALRSDVESQGVTPILETAEVQAAPVAGVSLSWPDPAPAAPPADKPGKRARKAKT